MEGNNIETDQNRANIGKGWIVVRDCRLFRLGPGVESFVKVYYEKTKAFWTRDDQPFVEDTTTCPFLHSFDVQLGELGEKNKRAMFV